VLERPAFARSTIGVAAALVALLLAVAPRYGPHRDELYFVAAGRRLAWGYPDQPPLTPAIASLVDTVAPGSLVALRSVSAAAMALVVVLAALCARELGGAAPAQRLAAIVTATSVLTMAIGHLLSTATFDTLAWAVVLWLVLRTLVRDEPRTWLAVGVAAGVALENKTLVLGLLVALVVGVGLTPAVRHHLRSPWAWAGALIALLLWVPNLVWQAGAGWPQLALAGDIQDEYGALGERIAYVGLQLAQVSPLAAPLWIFGIVRLLRDDRWRAARPIAWSYVVLALAFLVVGGKAYYLGGLMPVLLAAGSVALVERWSERRITVAAVALALTAAVAWPIGLPLLPASWWASSPYAVASDDQTNTIGWPAVVASIREAVDGSDAEVVLTWNYGEAGAAEWYGVDVPVFSGHNGFGRWGPPPEGAGPVVVVGFDDTSGLLEGCREVDRVDLGFDIDSEEQDASVQVCTGPVGGWASAWPRVLRLSA